MTSWQAVIILGLVFLLLREIILALIVLKRMRQSRKDMPCDNNCPRAAVILPLRGADPSLMACLDALAKQDYPDYILYLILDSEQDPAVGLVEQLAAVKGRDNIRVEYLRESVSSSSLKCACLSQVLGGLDKDIDVIVLTDADAVPGRLWLREVVTRLEHSDAQALTGIRWFDPRGRGVAALIRYIWNAASVVQMYRYGIAWGGCLAFERGLFEETDLVDRLRHAYGEDTLLDSVLQEHDLAMVFDPSLVLLTREDTSFTGFLGWACRQMISVRLHHSGWFRILLFGLLQWLLVLSCLILALQGLWTGNNVQAGIAGLTLLGYALLQSLLLLVGENMISDRIAVEDKTQSPLSRRQILMLPVAILLTQILHGFILLAAVFKKTVTWRGIPYRIEGKGKIRLLSYTPYVQKKNIKNRSL